MGKDFTILLIVWGYRHYWGKQRSLLWSKTRKEFLWNKLHRGESMDCEICGEWCPKHDRTVDHIIPRNILFEVELVGLEFDHRNLRLAHKKCNSDRGRLTIDDMPDSIRDKLFVLLETNTPT